MRSEKGQSLAEWALVALFAVGVFYFFRESSLLSQVRGSYDNVGRYLSSTPSTEQAINKYGKIANSVLRQESNDLRIALDKTSLQNLAGVFLGKTKAEINAMLTGNANFNKYNPNQALNQGTLLFDYYIKSTGDGEDGAVRTVFDNGLVAKDNLLNWMQGNYTQFQSTEKTRESDCRYFFSDDLIDPSGVLNGTPHQAGEYAVSVRCTFAFNSQGQAESVRIWATRNKKDTETGQWIRNETDGLMNIVVTK
ncbi:hypothetical protein [Selenomonas sp. GACV-9]|uniref:hypothetical protein n=1 Tax=Selenomonas sp. GACV-9 TaxID=3158782 RepID=UPI0011608189